jgi:hypothetical protein
MTASGSFKYAKPQILLVDMDSESVDALRQAGFNVSTGSFGSLSQVETSGHYHHVTMEDLSLPGMEEQEIVIVNTAPTAAIDRGDPPSPGTGVTGLWQDGTSGEIDPRPLAMHTFAHICERILDYGGIFIVVLSPKYEIKYVSGTQDEYKVHFTREYTYSNWDFLRDLDAFETRRRGGTEIAFDPPLLSRGSEGAWYECIVGMSHPLLKKRWVSLATNKYGESVAGVLAREKKGAVLLLPQMPNLHLVIVEILQDWCTQWSPQLFPHHEGLSWLHEPPYEIPEITAKCDQIKQIETEAAKQVAQLRAEVDEVRIANLQWYTLLNGTGRELVLAVMQVLQNLGFKKVVDVDQVAAVSGGDPQLREDIQITDNLPVLVVDVKGLAGGPTDADATQSEKHALMRAKEFEGNVKPLTIINHQKNLPPAARDNNVFRPEIVSNAKMTGLALMSTIDLFWIRENMNRLGWPPSVVTPIFYRSGRLDPTPAHYVELGKIVKVWTHSFGINPLQEVKVGSRIAIEIGHQFFEIEAPSLKVNGDDVQVAPQQSDCGVPYPPTLRLKENMRVFLVNP